MIGIKTGHEFATNKEGTQIVVMLQVQMSEPEDVQSVELFTQTGDETIPPDESEIIVTELSPGWKIGIASKDGIDPTMEAGERKAYSTDSSGDIAAFVNFLNTGILELNGNTDFAILFNALNSQLQTFVSDINTALSTKLDGGGTAGSLSLDISSAKSSTVKL